MPEDVKINLVNEMALPPACWTAMTTMAKTETKVSTARHDFAKNPGKKSRVRKQTHTRNTLMSYQMITAIPYDIRVPFVRVGFMCIAQHHAFILRLRWTHPISLQRLCGEKRAVRA
jgi:hypothetical protein